MSEEGHIVNRSPHHKPTQHGGGKVFDVRRPGKGTVSSTSKPVIPQKPIRDTSMLQDNKPTPPPAIPAPVKVEPPVTPLASVAATPELANVAAELASQPPETEAQPTPAPAPEIPAEAPKEVPAVAELTEVHEDPVEPADSVPEVKEEAEPTPVPTVTPATQEPEDEPESFEEKPSVPTDSTLPPPLSEQVPGLDEGAASRVPGIKPTSHEPLTTTEATADTHPTTDEVKAKAELDTPVVIDKSSIVVGNEHTSIPIFKIILWLIAVILTVAIVGDILLDAGLVTTSVSIPHTHFIEKQ